jgi:hypothetical protein
MEMTHELKRETSDFDLNTADAQADVIPDGERVRVRLSLSYGGGGPDLVFHRARSSGALMLQFEATILEGKYARRSFWPRFYMGAEGGEMTDGQRTAIGISRRTLRAIVEAARGIAPTDQTPAAIEARQLKSPAELDGMECWVITGIEKGNVGFDDRTIIKRVLPHRKEVITANEEPSSASSEPPF